MHPIICRILTGFIPSKNKRKLFREKYLNKQPQINHFDFIESKLDDLLLSVYNMSHSDKDENSIFYIQPQPILGKNFEKHNFNKKQILILGYYGHYNCGDELMLKSLLKVIDENAEISVMFIPSYRYNFNKNNNNHFYYPPKNIRDVEKIENFYDELIIGGGAHIDDTINEHLDFIPYIGIQLSKKMIEFNKIVKWIGVSSNKSLNDANYITNLSYIVENCADFSVRDTYSKNILINSGINGNKIKLVNDLALLYPKTKIIAVTFVNFFNDDNKIIQYINDIVSFCKTSKETYKICFLPFFNANYHDTKMINNLINQVNFRDVEYYIASEYKTVDDMILMIKGCDIMVNMRYHASLLGLQYEKQVISICYDTHPHYFNKVNYIHEQFNNNNIILHSKYKKDDLYNLLVKINKND